MVDITKDEVNVLCAFDHGITVRGYNDLVERFKARGWLEQSWHLSAEGQRILEEQLSRNRQKA